MNDFPVIVVNPASLTTTEDVAGGLKIQAIQISDPDVSETPGGELLVTLRVSHGTLTVRDNLGTQFLKPGDISGNGTGTVFLAASPAEINNTLTARRRPDLPAQSAVLRARTSSDRRRRPGPDRAWAAEGFVQGSLTITVDSVNDPPSPDRPVRQEHAGGRHAVPAGHLRQRTRTPGTRTSRCS